MELRKLKEIFRKIFEIEETEHILMKFFGKSFLSLPSPKKLHHKFDDGVTEYFSYLNTMQLQSSAF